MMLNLITLSGVSRYNESPFNQIIFKLANNIYFILSMGLGIPLVATILCLAIPGIQSKQGMMIEVGKAQQIISIILLLIVILCVGYLLIIYARAKSLQNKKSASTNGNYERINDYLDDDAADEENTRLNRQNGNMRTFRRNRAETGNFKLFFSIKYCFNWFFFKMF